MVKASSFSSLITIIIDSEYCETRVPQKHLPSNLTFVPYLSYGSERVAGRGFCG